MNHITEISNVLDNIKRLRVMEFYVREPSQFSQYKAPKPIINKWIKLSENQIKELVNE